MSADSSSSYPYLFGSDTEVTRITDLVDECNSLTDPEGRVENGYSSCDSGRMSKVSNLILLIHLPSKTMHPHCFNSA